MKETYKTCVIVSRMGLWDVYNKEMILVLAGWRSLTFAKRFVDLLDEQGYLEP